MKSLLILILVIFDGFSFVSVAESIFIKIKRDQPPYMSIYHETGHFVVPKWAKHGLYFN